MITHTSLSFTALINAGLKSHLQAHYEELNDQAFPLDPDWTKYAQLEQMDLLRCYAAFDDNELIGYAIFLLGPSIHYSSSKWAFEDIYRIVPEFRKGMTGYKFVKYFLSQIEQEVDKVVIGTKTKLEVGKLFERLGYKHFENLYSKVTQK